MRLTGIRELDLKIIDKLDLETILKLLYKYDYDIYSLIMESIKVKDKDFKENILFWIAEISYKIPKDCIKIYLDYLIDKIYTDQNERNIGLIEASRRGYIEIACILLEKGADIHTGEGGDYEASEKAYDLGYKEKGKFEADVDYWRNWDFGHMRNKYKIDLLI